MTSMLQAWRALARRPLFTIATLLTMTAGIGVATAVFSIVDWVLIRPLPYPDGDQLVSVYEASPSRRDQPRLNARFLTVFAGAALALAAVGLYGLLTLLISDRRQELGVRIALGASRSDLVRLVIAGAGRLIALGMASGLILTFAASQILQTLLFGVTAHDPRALAAGMLALAIVSTLAIAIPARQAARIDPIEAIRGE